MPSSACGMRRGRTASPQSSTPRSARGGRVEPFRDFIAIGVLSPIVTHFCPDRPQLRAQLIASQIIGLGLARWVARMDHIAALDAEALVALVGPTIQRYAFDDLPGLADSA